MVEIDLSLVAMDDMVKEIKKRFDTLAVLTCRQVDKENDDLRYHFKDKIGCLGLMEIAKKQICAGYERNETGSFD